MLGNAQRRRFHLAAVSLLLASCAPLRASSPVAPHAMALAAAIDSAKSSDSDSDRSAAISRSPFNNLCEIVNLSNQSLHFTVLQHGVVEATFPVDPSRTLHFRPEAGPSELVVTEDTGQVLGRFKLNLANTIVVVSQTPRGLVLRILHD